MRVRHNLPLRSGGLTVISLDYLIKRIWDELGLVKVYTKKRGAHPDLDDPVCLRKGATIEVRHDERDYWPCLTWHAAYQSGRV